MLPGYKKSSLLSKLYDHLVKPMVVPQPVEIEAKYILPKEF